MKKICFMGAGAYGSGGVETVLTQVANELSKNYEIMIISSNSKMESKYDYNSQISIVDFDAIGRKSITRIIENYYSKIVGKIIKTLKLENSDNIYIQALNRSAIYPVSKQKRMIKQIKLYEPDLTIGVGRGSLLLGIISKKINGKKIGWQHSSYNCFMNIGDSIVWPNLNKYVIKLLKRLDYYFVLTEDDKAKYKEKDLKCIVMPNFIELLPLVKSDLKKR